MYPDRIHHEYSLSPEDAYFQRERFNHKHDAIARSVALIGSSVTAMLGLRFVLALLAANATNGFASFIYRVTEPLVMPFYGLFNYDHASVGSVSFQGYTLVAILAYGLITAGITKAVTITRY